MNKDKLLQCLKRDAKPFGNQYLDTSGKIKVSNYSQALDSESDAFNPKLVAILLNDPTIEKCYVIDIGGTKILKVEALSDLVRYSDSLKHNYTKYANKIGLTVNGKFINDSSNVVIDFPYKDCLLKASMKKSYKKVGKKAPKWKQAVFDPDEPYWNEVLSKPECDELLEPKVFSNITKYTSTGATHPTSFKPHDNLMIRGNNLIALHSLMPVYAGKVKLIYIDPPFNTGEDSFGYNDSFSHSAWLTFMKDRLYAAKKMLSNDGFIFVNIDNNESAYLKVLMDEIFGRENYIESLVLKSNALSGLKMRNRNRTILNDTNDIHVYAKNKRLITENADITPQYTAKDGWETRKNKFLVGRNTKSPKLLSLKSVLVKNNIISKSTPIKKSLWDNSKFRDFIESHADSVCQTTEISDKSLAAHVVKDNQIHVIHQDNNTQYLYNNSRVIFLSNSEHIVHGKLVPANLLGNLWSDISFKSTEHEGDIKFTDAKKPERLLKRIISMTTKKGDIVLDFFAGSATTQAVAMKMHRQFIGIEQMDYIKSISIPRLINVIKGEQHGISRDEDVNWHGGGSFVSFQLADKANQFIEELKAARNDNDLDRIYDEMKGTLDINFKVDLYKFESFRKQLSFDEERHMLHDILDLNQLYYCYHDIDSQEVKGNVSASDIEFTKSFYNKEGVDRG